MYENRIIAYIDILGFKNEIEKKTINPSSKKENNKESKRIYDFISVVHKDFVKRNISHDSSYKVSQFSDSLVFSYSASEKAAVFWILMGLLYLHLDAINHGLLIRGAVTFGKLVHDDNHLFGPAMDEVYKMESECAIFPRIIVDKDLIGLASKNPNSSNSPDDEKRFIENLLKQDFDGFLYIDYFFKGCEEIIASEDYHVLPEFISKLSSLIKNNESNKDLRIMQKYNWLKQRFNSVVKYYKTFDYNQNPEYKDVATFFYKIKLFKIAH